MHMHIDSPSLFTINFTVCTKILSNSSDNPKISTTFSTLATQNKQTSKQKTNFIAKNNRKTFKKLKINQ